MEFDFKGPLNVYIENPYCKEICDFCLYYRKKENDEFERYYKEYLPKEISKIDYDELDSVYFGGGTVSIVPLEYLENIFKMLPPAKEKTFEVHTKYYDPELFDLLRKYNFDAISLGIQTFSDKLSKYRTHVSYADIEKMVENIKDFKLNFELIGGLGNAYDLKEDLIKAYSLNPDMLSVYGLYQSEKAGNFTVRTVHDSVFYNDDRYLNDNLASSLPIRDLLLRESLTLFPRFNTIKFYKEYPLNYLKAMTKNANLFNNLYGVGAPLNNGSFRDGAYSIIPDDKKVYNINTINNNWITKYKIDSEFNVKDLKHRKAKIRLNGIKAKFKIIDNLIITNEVEKAKALLKGYKFEFKEW